MLTIDSDAHGVETLANIRYGVATARRAWLDQDSIANTRSWEPTRCDKRRKRGVQAVGSAVPVLDGSARLNPGVRTSFVGLNGAGRLDVVAHAVAALDRLDRRGSGLRHASPARIANPPRSPAPAARGTRRRRRRS